MNRSIAAKNMLERGQRLDAAGRAACSSVRKKSVIAFRPLNSSSPAVRSWNRIGSCDERVVVVQRVQRDRRRGRAYSTWTGMSGRWANRLTSVLDVARTVGDRQLGMMVQALASYERMTVSVTSSPPDR